MDSFLHAAVVALAGAAAMAEAQAAAAAAAAAAESRPRQGMLQEVQRPHTQEHMGA